MKAGRGDTETRSKKPSACFAFSPRPRVPPPRVFYYYEQALQLQPDFYEAQFFLANLEILRGRYEHALALVEEVLPVNPTDNPALWTAGYSALLLGRLDEARAYLERQRASLDVVQVLGTQNSSWEPSMLALLGYIHRRQGDADEAALLFEQALAAAQRYLDDGSENAWLLYDQAAIYALRSDHARRTLPSKKPSASAGASQTAPVSTRCSRLCTARPPSKPCSTASTRWSLKRAPTSRPATLSR